MDIGDQSSDLFIHSNESDMSCFLNITFAKHKIILKYKDFYFTLPI